MSELTKIIKRIALAGFVVLSLQLISAYFLWPFYNPALAKITKGLNTADVVFFSDSSDSNLAPTDKAHTKAISEVLSNEISPLTLRAIAEPAYHLHTFEAFTKYITRLAKRPKVAVYSINARSFSPEYYLRPAYVFPALCSELVFGPTIFRALIRPLHIFGLKYKEDTFPHSTYPVTFEGKVIGVPSELDNLKGNNHLTAEQKRLWIEYAYGYPLTTDHPLFLSIKSIIKETTENEIEPIFYFTPIDVTTSSEWFGSAFPELLSVRMDMIAKFIQEEKGSYLDLSQKLKQKNHFYHQNVIAEHLSYLGRDFVGTSLAKKVRKAYYKNGAEPRLTTSR